MIIENETLNNAASVWTINNKVKHLLSNGVDGGTFSMNGERTGSTGYMVSIRGPEEIVTPECILESGYQPVANFLFNNEELLSNENHFFGFWSCSGKVYLDVSVRFECINKAHQFGYDNKQLAIWDLANMVEITL
tara:strand:- start:384 stop:788 length:405 start_codon:yes stop_codon:yes gene_type:complete